MSTFVSIIIPTFNRADLISETLDSISKQTYAHWECLIVDDGSSDDTINILSKYHKKDARFKIFKRPESTLKGANSCRNIGLQQAQGDYVVFFDSDDLMTTNHLEVKVTAMQSGAYDFVVTETRYFNNDRLNKIREKQYMFNTNDISAFNYITHRINWLTLDVCIKTEIAKSLRFNENLHSGQEYNYFCKLILKSTKATFIKKIVSYERYHENSIRGLLRENKIEQSQGYLYVYWHTYLEIKDKATKKGKDFLIYRCYRLLGKLPIKEKLFEKSIHKAILKEFGLRGVYYIFRLYLKRII